MVKGLSTPKHEMALSHPKVILDERYQIAYSVGVLLGKGGFAHCFQVTSDGDDFAMKIIDRKRLNGQSSLAKIQKEIAIHYKLRHPHIVTLYRSFEDVAAVYMLLEYCPHGTLLDLLQNYPGMTLPENEAIVYLRQLLKAVNYLHSECGIIHRDIKPGNILIAKDNSIKLADFGFAAFIDENSQATQHSVCGTPNYIAPEVIDKQGHSKYSEYWAIACTFYCMLCGKPPFDSDSLEATYNRIRRCLYHFPNFLPISAKSMDFISRILKKNPLDRMAMVEMFKHSIFSQFNRSSSHASGLNGNLDGNRLSTTSFSPKGSSQILRSKRSSNLLDSGFESDHGDAMSKYLNLLLGKYLNVVRDLISPGSCIDLSLHPDVCLPGNFVVKWVDYSNKYGFACTMRNGVRSMLYNDQSNVVISADSKICSYRARKFSDDFMEIYTMSEEMYRFPEVAKKFSLTRDLCSYMDKELSGTVIEEMLLMSEHGNFSTHNPYIIDYKKFKTGLVMLMSDGSCQVNLSESHVKLMLRRSKDDFILTTLVPNKGPMNYTLRQVVPGSSWRKGNNTGWQHQVVMMEFYQLLADFSKLFAQQNPVIYSTDC